MFQGFGSKLGINCFRTATRKAQFDTIMSNQLRNEFSPYLLQHQHNPVHWLPWNSDTLELAKRSNKPIFMSSGYSTCHWCHVMERESFENQEIADIMNSKFINIKLDREERPNIDGIYMHVVQAITGSGGWPMSIWMTPDLMPFYAGTYFPPSDRNYGRPGFKSILLTISEHWEESRDKCLESAEKIVDVLKKSAIIPVIASLPPEAAKNCRNQLRRSYEPAFGGFTEQPKFPQPVNHQFLIHYSKKEEECFNMVAHSLTMMRKGGIYDHLGQGFSRYSTDKKWHVPHFEKMLYDQGQLVSVYLNAYLVSKNEKFSTVAHEILEYVSRDMSIEGGGFYSAEDADSLPTKASTEKKEGAFYVWEKNEIQSILGSYQLSNGKKLDDLVCSRFGVKENGNVNPHQDPHDELKKKNVLYLDKEITDLAKEFDIPEAEVISQLETARGKLFDWRNIHRPRPHLDNKFIASWSGLMTSAYSQAGFIFSNESYIERAVKAIIFIEENFLCNGDLLRTCYSNKDGLVVNLEKPIPGCVDDFANVIGALLELFQATSKAHYLNLAVQLQRKQDELFWDEKNGGYFTGRADDLSVIVRMKDDDDGAEPSSNSTSVINLMRLNSLFPHEYDTRIEKLLHQFANTMSKLPITVPLMTTALMSYQGGTSGSIILIGKKIRSSAFYTFLQKKLLPVGTIIITLDLDTDLSELETLIPSLGPKIREAGHGAVAFIQRGKTETKVQNVEELATFFD